MAFQTCYGHFKYPVVFLSLFDTLAGFQKYINKILAKKLNIFVIIYLVHISIYIEDSN